MNKKIRFLFTQVLIISLIVGISGLSVSAMPMAGMGSPDKQDSQQMQAMVKEAMMKPEMKVMMGMMKEMAMKPEAKPMTLSASEPQSPPSANQPVQEPDHKAEHNKHQQK